eukprot:GHVQ01042741.1.p1 GENE.GHVQ01042741.1~~GHVQ01042741.1.p1  ORF type:complete len:358 (-),score=55.84 GHVQ01042741.1:298-1371(-)
MMRRLAITGLAIGATSFVGSNAAELIDHANHRDAYTGLSGTDVEGRNLLPSLLSPVVYVASGIKNCVWASAEVKAQKKAKAQFDILEKSYHLSLNPLPSSVSNSAIAKIGAKLTELHDYTAAVDAKKLRGLAENVMKIERAATNTCKDVVQGSFGDGRDVKCLTALAQQTPIVTYNISGKTVNGAVAAIGKKMDKAMEVAFTRELMSFDMTVSADKKVEMGRNFADIAERLSANKDIVSWANANASKPNGKVDCQQRSSLILYTTILFAIKRLYEQSALNEALAAAAICNNTETLLAAMAKPTSYGKRNWKKAFRKPSDPRDDQKAWTQMLEDTIAPVARLFASKDGEAWNLWVAAE